MEDQFKHALVSFLSDGIADQGIDAGGLAQTGNGQNAVSGEEQLGKGELQLPKFLDEGKE